MNCEPPYLRVALQLTLICQGPTSRVFKALLKLLLAPGSTWPGPFPCLLSQAFPGLLLPWLGQLKYGLGHCQRSPPRSNCLVSYLITSQTWTMRRLSSDQLCPS